MSESQVITINVHEDYVAEVTTLAADAQGAVRLGKFRAAQPLGPPSTFPILDPNIIEAIKQATIILSTGTAALTFLTKLRALISSSNGKVSARDDRSNDAIK
jgi:hypothetical protein